MTHAKYDVEFLLDKQKILFFVTSSTVETSLDSIQFSDIHVHFLRIMLLLGSDTGSSETSYAFTIYKVYTSHVNHLVKLVRLTTLFAYANLSRNSFVYLMVSSFLTPIY